MLGVVAAALVALVIRLDVFALPEPATPPRPTLAGQPVGPGVVRLSGAVSCPSVRACAGTRVEVTLPSMVQVETASLAGVPVTAAVRDGELPHPTHVYSMPVIGTSAAHFAMRLRCPSPQAFDARVTVIYGSDSSNQVVPLVCT